MAHGQHRHYRVGKLHSLKHRREIGQNEGAPDSALLLEGNPAKLALFSTTDISPEEDCDMSQNPACLAHKMNESDASLERREASVPDDVAAIETVVQIVEPTASNSPVAVSDSTTLAIPDSDSMTATASLDVTASVDISLASPTLAPATTQSPISLLAEISLGVNSMNQAKSSLIIAASAINSFARISTPLIAPSSSTPVASTKSHHVNNYWSDPSSGSSSFTASETYVTSSQTVLGGLGQTATATGASSVPSETGTQASGQDGTNNDSNTPKIVGGVVGSVAGLALIIVLLLYFLRRRGFFLKNKGHTAISDDAAVGSGIGALVGLGAAAGTREVAERHSTSKDRFRASYFGPAFTRRWRQSTATTGTQSTLDSTSSERGFQKISGRKIPPVLTHGGDGYGGGLDGDSPSASGFPITPPGTEPMGNPSFPAPPRTLPYGMPLDSNYTRETKEQGSPSRSAVHLPISSQVNVAHPITVTPAPDLPQAQSAIPSVPPRPDGLGRSLHSYDGSRSSRFTESIDM